ncbi:type II secretion system protein [Vibrio vulnificus]|uniref:type II secretion system protein n=1 Tax=Vibrio vulnificus TaxID=672 RepID=UPI00102B2D33|nr:type II secretion system protein [Vibrio vulnificus]RZR39136.1 type II secretion system protein [Vibrio vulnificus]
MLKKQRGFALIAGMLIVIAVLSVGTVHYSQYLAKQRIIDNTESFFNRVLYLKNQIHAYANDHYLQGVGINSPNIFPARLTDLEGTYVPECTTANNQKGFCRKVNQTPWGDISTRDYRRALVTSPSGANYYRAEFDLHLPDKDDPAFISERRATLSLFSQLPNIIYDDAKNMITVRVDRPDKAFAYEGLVKRSGDDSTLLGDWDVGGNYAITNAKDFTIRNSDGTQTLLGRSIFKGALMVKDGDLVAKPSCPVNTKPNINLSISHVEITSAYLAAGSTKTFLIEETDKHWKVGIVTRVRNIENNNYEEIRSGVISAVISCM